MKITSVIPFLLFSLQQPSTYATVRLRSLTRPLAIGSLVFTWGSGPTSISDPYAPPAVWASDLVPVPFGIRESIAKGAATIPGIGQPDVYYPERWEGRWTVTQTYTDIVEQRPTSTYVNVLQQIRSSSSAGIPTSVQYNLNMMKRDGKVIVDRSVAETNRYRALLQLAGATGDGGDTSVQWLPSNPNTLTVNVDLSTLPTPASMLTMEEKVTKRAVEQNLPPDAFGYSEYARLMESSAKGSQYGMGVPKIYGVRRLQRLRVEPSDPIETTSSPPPVDVIKGVERMYIYDGESLDIKENPLAIIKSNFVMKRIVE